MNIVVISRSRWIHSTRRLIQAGEALGHRVRIVDPLHCTLLIDQPKPKIFYKGRRLVKADVVIPRIGASVTHYGLSVLKTFESRGIPVLNDAVAVAMARDKFLSLQILSRNRIAVPRTLFARNPRDLDAKLDLLGELPVVLKLMEGTHGVGVMLAENRDAVHSIVSSFWELGKNIFLQRFVSESKGKDIRAFVVGGQVVGAMRRTAKVGEFRSNIHRGGQGERVDLAEPYVRAALRAAKVLNLRVAGVDLLESSEGPLVMEVNASPGLQGIEAATGIDIAAAIIRYAVNYTLESKE
jgi:ribosomal protein S6--L-glutamate ligase